MRTSRLFVVGGLFVSFAWLMAGGCASSNSPSSNGPSGNGTSGSGGGGQGDPAKVTPDASGIDSGSTNDLNPLCGVMDSVSCVPDNGSACTDYVPPKPGAGGEGGAAGAESTSTGGASGGAGAGGETGGEGGMNGGAPSHADASGAGPSNGGAGASNGGAGAGGEAGHGPAPSGLAAYGCQVTLQNDQPLRQCVRAGQGSVNAPCFSAADCAPSLACVTENGAGRCLPYCCNQDTNCTSGTFCAKRPLRKAASDMSDAEPPNVPVCVPADACSLEDPFPCPSGTDCRCKDNTACMVVRGTTTCMKPGTGQQGDACPCAWNHVCSSVTQQCIKICRTDPSKNDCGAQKCQASSELPQNFGVCVGPLK